MDIMDIHEFLWIIKEIFKQMRSQTNALTIHIKLLNPELPDVDIMDVMEIPNNYIKDDTMRLGCTNPVYHMNINRVQL